MKLELNLIYSIQTIVGQCFKSNWFRNVHGHKDLSLQCLDSYINSILIRRADCAHHKGFLESIQALQQKKIYQFFKIQTKIFLKKAKLADSICNSVISLRFFICSHAFLMKFFSCASKYVKIHVYVARSAGGRPENQKGAQRNRRSLIKKSFLYNQNLESVGDASAPLASMIPPALARQRLKKGFSFTKQ